MSPYSRLGALTGCNNAAQLQGSSTFELGCGFKQMDRLSSLSYLICSSASAFILMWSLFLPCESPSIPCEKGFGFNFLFH